MNSLQFVNALAADPTARVFIDKYGCASVANLVDGRWLTAPTRSRSRDEAPSPCARFPASPEGWDDALAYARGKVGGARKP